MIHSSLFHAVPFGWEHQHLAEPYRRTSYFVAIVSLTYYMQRGFCWLYPLITKHQESRVICSLIVFCAVFSGANGSCHLVARVKARSWSQINAGRVVIPYLYYPLQLWLFFERTANRLRVVQSHQVTPRCPQTSRPRQWRNAAIVPRKVSVRQYDSSDLLSKVMVCLVT